MASDRLDRRQLNRATLARQFLLARANVPVVDAVEQLVGLQSQAPLAHYVDLDAVVRAARDLARDAPLSRAELGRLLGERFPGLPENALAYAATYCEPMVQVPPRGVWGRRGQARWQTFRGWLQVDADRPANAETVVLR